MRLHINNCIQLTATKLSYEESYTQKDLFINQVFDQLTSGIYEYAMVVDQEGRVNFKLKTFEKEGKLVVERQPNPFQSYKIGITKVTVRDIDYAEEINRSEERRVGK